MTTATPTVPTTATEPRPSRAAAPAPATKSSNWGFVRKFWKILVAIKDALVLIFMLLFFVLLFSALSASPNPQVSVSDGALLVDLEGTISEQPSQPDPFTVLQGGNQVREHRARDVVRALEVAATDARVKVVVLDLDGFLGGGQVAVGDVAEAVGKVRAAKKPVLAYATGYGDDAYLIASQASEMWTSPYGGAIISGPGGSNLYFKSLLDRLGVEAKVYRVGTFKSAVEPFIRDDQSPEAKEAANAYASVLWEQWQTKVKAARPKAQLDAFVGDPVGMMKAAGNDLSKAALNAGMVDKVGERLAFDRRVAEIAGTDDETRPWEYRAIKLDNWIAANPAPTDGEAIAVVPLVGEIVDGEALPGVAAGDTISGHILDAVADTDVKAVVLRVDSPGGSVLASEKIRQALLQAKARKLPVVISMSNLAASGGYWVATPGDRIIAEPDTITGSIGVFGVIPTFDKALGKIGVNADGIRTTPLSGQPDVLDGTNAEFDALAQAGVEDIYARFTGLVATSRKLPIEKVREIAEGRVWAGGTARQLGLVDEFGGLKEAIDTAAKLAKLDPKNVSPRYFEEGPDPFAELLRGFMGEEEAAYARAPRGWFAQASWHRNAQIAGAVADLQRLGGAEGIQARCLECATAGSTLQPRLSKATQQQASWLMRLFGG
jgi:protease IV